MNQNLPKFIKLSTQKNRILLYAFFLSEPFFKRAMVGSDSSEEPQSKLKTKSRVLGLKVPFSCASAIGSGVSGS